MSNEDFSYEGTIDGNYKKKIILKSNLILIPTFLSTALIIWAIGISVDPHGYVPIVFWLTIFSAVIPYCVIMMAGIPYLSSYVRRFSYEIKEHTIVINHGVFTRITATIPFSRIQNINVVNGVFDRAYKIYTVKIETAGGSIGGEGGVRPEGYIPGLKDPSIVGKKIKEMMTKYSLVPSGLEDKIFKPEEMAFDNFIGHIISKMHEGDMVKASVKEFREKASMSIIDLAGKVGMPVHTIKLLEEGKYNPSITLVCLIADVLNCRLDDLFKLK